MFVHINSSRIMVRDPVHSVLFTARSKRTIDGLDMSISAVINCNESRTLMTMSIKQDKQGIHQLATALAGLTSSDHHVRNHNYQTYKNLLTTYWLADEKASS